VGKVLDFLAFVSGGVDGDDELRVLSGWVAWVLISMSRLAPVLRTGL
jgi:hypothetical protein